MVVVCKLTILIYKGLYLVQMDETIGILDRRAGGNSARNNDLF